MTYSNSISAFDNSDDLPRPAATIVSDPSASVLPRPMSSQPNIADTGRISFGAGMRIRSSK